MDRKIFVYSQNKKKKKIAYSLNTKCETHKTFCFLIFLIWSAQSFFFLLISLFLFTQIRYIRILRAVVHTTHYTYILCTHEKKYVTRWLMIYHCCCEGEKRIDKKKNEEKWKTKQKQINIYRIR